MTGERDLACGCENPDTTGVSSFCRKHERGLGEIKLARDLLHLFLGEPLGLRQHRQLIPAKAPLGEYIADVVLVVHEFGLKTYKLISAFPVRGNDKIPSQKGENITKLKESTVFSRAA